MKGVQCYELFGGIALKNHAFSFFFILLEQFGRKQYEQCFPLITSSFTRTGWCVSATWHVRGYSVVCTWLAQCESGIHTFINVKNEKESTRSISLDLLKFDDPYLVSQAMKNIESTLLKMEIKCSIIDVTLLLSTHLPSINTILHFVIQTALVGSIFSTPINS